MTKYRYDILAFTTNCNIQHKQTVLHEYFISNHFGHFKDLHSKGSHPPPPMGTSISEVIKVMVRTCQQMPNSLQGSEGIKETSMEAKGIWNGDLLHHIPETHTKFTPLSWKVHFVSNHNTGPSYTQSGIPSRNNKYAVGWITLPRYDIYCVRLAPQ